MLWIDIENAAGTKQGPGPIWYAHSYRYTERLDEAGDFSFELPATFDRSGLVVARYIARAFSIVNGLNAEIGCGVIARALANYTDQSHAVNGQNLLAELNDRSVGSLVMDDGAGGDTLNGPTLIMAFAPAGWSLDVVTGHNVTLTATQYEFSGDSVLSALCKLAELTGEHFRLGVGKKVIWLQTDQDDSGITACQPNDSVAAETNDLICTILNFAQEQDDQETITRVIPYGSGQGSERTTINGCGFAPGGYTVDELNNYIAYDAGEAGGTIIERVQEWPDIKKPLPLAVAAYNWLAARNGTAVYYRMTVGKLETRLYPGQLIHVSYHDWVDSYQWINVEDDFVILEVTVQVDETGVRTAELLVGNTSRFPLNDAIMVIDGLKKFKGAFTHVQPMSYTEGIPDLDLTLYAALADNEIITGLWNFSPPIPRAPFSLAANAQGICVTGLYADQLSKSVIAGAGLTGGGALTADRTLAVGAGNGITVNADDVAVNESYAFTWGALHIFNAGVQIAAGQTLAFGADVALQRAGADILGLATGDAFRSSNYVSGVSGWAIEADGTAEFGNAFIRGELHSTIFVKDLVEAHAGSMVIAKSAGVLSAAVAIPDPGGWEIVINDPPGGGFLFDNNDICEVVTEYASGVAVTWFTVAGRTDNGDGTQHYDCTYQAGTKGVTIPAGSPIVDYGVSGQGSIFFTAELANAPYIDVRTHAGSPWTAVTVKTRLGNLAGITDTDLTPSGYGLYSDNAFLKGALIAGNGAVVLDANGVSIEPGTGTLNKIIWKYDASNYAEINGDATASSGTFFTNVRGTTSAGADLYARVDADNYADISGSTNSGDLSSCYINLTMAGQGYTNFLKIGTDHSQFEKSVMINDISNAKCTLGLTINQADADDEILSLKCTDIAHGMTDITETDTYGYFKLSYAASGGLQIGGLTSAEAGNAILLNAVQGAALDTTKSTAGIGALVVNASIKSGTTNTTPGANANLMVIRSGSSTKFIFDAEGDAHCDSSGWTVYDDQDDIGLLDSLSEMVVRQSDPIRQEFNDFLTSNRQRLEELGLVHFNEDGHHFVNTTKLSMLLVGAVRQLAGQLDELKASL